MKCIYCLEAKKEEYFTNREHVIPQCFGKFAPDNLILYQTVCDECNQYFGEKIELFLGRDSLEGIERLRHGIKAKKALRNRRRVKSKVYEGEWKGVIVTEKAQKNSNEIGLEMVLQAGFYNKFKHEYDYFEPEDIPRADDLLKNGYDFKNKMVWMIAKEGSELDSLVELLNKKGVQVKSNNHLVRQTKEGEKVTVESNLVIDRVIFRGLSKIAFNYLALIAGKDLVLDSAFDQIRRFIRNDEGKSENFVAVNVPPILYEDQRLEKFRAKVTQGHLIIVGWKEPDLFSKVSLFNTTTYLIKLCQRFSGIWRPIKAGHHFNIKNRRVERLGSISKSAIALS